jgi:hypothetical protein
MATQRRTSGTEPARRTDPSAARGSSATPPAPTSAADEVPVVGPREPCPCGSGRRYKACHGRAGRTAPPVLRPFAGLAGECDWVALREIVPAATAPLALKGADQQATLSTVLPMAYPAMVRLDGSVFLGAQTAGGSGDVSRDLGTALATALASGPGTLVSSAELTADPVRLQDLLDVDAPLEVTVRPGFEFWVEGMDGQSPDPEVTASLERANSGIVPTARLTSVEAAYWAGLPERATLRWVLAEDEEPLLDALARLHVSGGLTLGEGTRFIGTFRAHGLLVPVWDLPAGSPADDAEEPATAFRGRLDEALAQTGPLTSAERHARSGLQTRQLTLH